MAGRINEWFVPKFGPEKFRVFVGMLFLPYTGMCISFTLIGSMLSPLILWDRVIAISLIYFLALGISAHALDALGSKNKPWGDVFSRKQLLFIAISALIPAYAIGIYYILYVPFLAIIAIVEGFFLFAYNMEIRKGYFHTNFWFAFSWGTLPLFAGFMMQTNSISLLAILGGIITGLVSYTEIKISRLYKELKRQNVNTNVRYERALKLLSICTITAASIMVLLRAFI